MTVTVSAGKIRPTGRLGLQRIEGKPTDRPPTLRDIWRHGMPRFGLDPAVNAWRRRNLRHLWRGLRNVMPARLLKIPHYYGALYLSVTRDDGSTMDYGLASLRLVTTTGVKYICDDFNAGSGSADVSNMKFHGFGTGAVAEAAADTALGTELTTQYATDNTRPTGSQASATVSANATYTTVATLSPDSGGTIAITEHGIFSASSAGTLLDRSVFSAVNLVASSDSLQATYVFTATSGG